MTRAPFIVIDGKLYRWKDILELRRAQLAAAGAAQAKPTGAVRNLARRSPPARREHGIGALSATGLVRKSGRSNKGEPPSSVKARACSMTTARVGPLLVNGIEQCLVDADLPVSDNVEFIPHRLFPIRHAYKPHLHNREIVLAKKELP
jgi:hypothetical protein